MVKSTENKIMKILENILLYFLKALQSSETIQKCNILVYFPRSFKSVNYMHEFCCYQHKQCAIRRIMIKNGDYNTA